MAFFKKLYDRFIGSEKLSESARLIGQVFDEGGDGQLFFDIVLVRFENFDLCNTRKENKSFSHDFDFITQCTMESLKSSEILEKFSNRIDSYLYIYRRIEEYLVLVKQSNYLTYTYEYNVKQLKEKLLESLSQVFIKNKGLQPNICIIERNQLARLKIIQLLKEITDINTKTIDTFFVLAKLSFQSSNITDGYGRLKWENIISNIKYHGLSIQDFISSYIDYELGFQNFPLDLPGFIKLIDRNHPFRTASESPFIIFLRLCKTLNMPIDAFFEQYRTIFENRLKNKSYTFAHIGSLFPLIGRHDRIFGIYFTIYSNSVDLDDLWNMFLNICMNGEINEINQNHLMNKLSTRTSNASIEQFMRYTKLSAKSIEKIKLEYRSRFLDIFQKIFEAFINKQLTEEQYAYRFSQSNLTELLQIGLVMSSTHDLCQPASLLIVQCLIFRIDNRNSNIADKIKSLFKKLNDFDQNLCEKNDPISIIKDEWLQDYLLRLPDDLSHSFNENTYNDLCHNHHDNRWTIYVWKRLIHLSILKSKIENTNEMLFSLNEWMRKVKHNNYVVSDTLTIIFTINVFELIIVKYTKSILSLANVDIILNFILNARQEQLHVMDTTQVDNFVENFKKSIQQLLILRGNCSDYRNLSESSIVYSLIHLIDLKTIMSSVIPQQYKFPHVTDIIESIVLPKPKDINLIDTENKEQYFKQFIQIVNDWLRWSDQFLLIFWNIVEWLKSCEMNEMTTLSNDMRAARNNGSITLINMKTIVDRTLKLLLHFKDLRRLCHLLNCLTSFQIIECGMLNNKIISDQYIRELKRFQPNNFFLVDSKLIVQYKISIDDRQNIQWYIASEKHPCNIKIEYQAADLYCDPEIIFDDQNVSIDRNVLEGEFETQRAGQLIFTFDSRRLFAPRKVWYHVKQTPLSTSHLFNGIFNMLYEKYSTPPAKQIKEGDISALLDKVFKFIDSLLNGTISLRDMTCLKAVFCDKNIRVKKEVKKLFTNRSSQEGRAGQRSKNAVPQAIAPTEDDIEQVCEWLQIYQYYSHISIIINCIETFDILPVDNNDPLISRLKRLRDENCSLKEITQTYDIVKKQFQSLSNQHLQLIKTALECSNTVKMMKDSDLYSPHGRRRFQELRDNLTMQFQLQERNNMILNSLIIAYALCEPFIVKANDFNDFVKRIAELSNFEENSLNHMKIVNDNVQIVNMWLSSEETTVLDNALITMGHLYKTGKVKIRLRRLMNEESYFEISYSIDKIKAEELKRTDSEDDEYEQHTDDERAILKFTLSMSDIEDHKRQLTFCNVDLQENMFYRKILLNEQLKLLKIVENIYSILLKLEMTGHPDYQLREEVYEIHDRTGEIDDILTDMRKDQPIREDRLKRVVKTRTENLELIYRTLKASFETWIMNLERYRQDTCLLNLLSNRQIMILIILLTITTAQNQIKCNFLKKILLTKDAINNRDKELKLTIKYLTHYLRSLKIYDCNLSEDHILSVYETYKIAPMSNVESSLKNLSEFLRELFHNGRELLKNNPSINENQQYLVTPTITRQTSEKTPQEHDLDMETCCILLNLFNDRLPAAYQMLWCSIATEDDVRLFFSRVRTFHYLVFVVMEIDKMDHRLREFLLNEQDALARQEQPHGPVYYFSRELTTSRKGLRAFHIAPKYQDSYQTYRKIIRLFQERNFTQPHVQIIYGTAGIGKTHCINAKYKDQDTSSFSINDTLNLSSLISSFLLYDSKQNNDHPSVSFNVSIHAPFKDLNRTFLSLFVCGSLNDGETGLTFSLPQDKQWKFFIEIPHTDKYNMTIKENLDRILPLLSIISPHTLEEVTDKNYQLFINKEEELVARFLKAYENRTIDRMMTITRTGREEPVDFQELTNPDECRELIYHCMTKYASEIPRNKISELSFAKFLYRRVRFFLGHFFRFNMTVEHLGSIVMKQMIQEAKHLAQIDFRCDNYPRIFLVYDPDFCLYLLRDDWNLVPRNIKTLFQNSDPSLRADFKNRDYFAKCLSWLINIKYDDFIKIAKETKFILTENFAYKIFHIHERKLTRLSLIIEGGTGVGKTFLLKFYSLLLNANITNAPMYDDKDSTDDDDDLSYCRNVAPHILERTSLWFLNNIIDNILEKNSNILNEFLKRIKPKILGLDDGLVDEPDNKIIFDPYAQQFDRENLVYNENDACLSRPIEISCQPQVIIPPVMVEEVRPIAEIIDAPLLKEMKNSLKNFEYTIDILRYMWKTLINVSMENAMNVAEILLNESHNYITNQLIKYPLAEASIKLREFLNDSHFPTVQKSMQMFDEYLMRTQMKPLFYRLLLHPGITEEQLENFMAPICQLARELPHIELVVFFDEVNTSSCLGLFKEMFMDRTLHGNDIPKNIFFTAAINPLVKPSDDGVIHRQDFLVHQLPQALENLKVSYGPLEPASLRDYINKKIAEFRVNTASNDGKLMPLEEYAQEMLAESIINAQDFCEKYLGKNSVSQREIQRCFNLIEFFWQMRFDDEIEVGDNLYQPNPVRCIALAIALIYYFRLPTDEDNEQRKDKSTPSRETLARLLSQTIPEFVELIQDELEKFVNNDNFVIPHAVAINQAVREHIFAIVISVVTRTPLCIIGAPGQSKTLSFQIVFQNLQGPQLSIKPFCKRLPAIDPFFCLGSKYTRSDDIAYIFERAIKREQQYQQNRMNTRCVVFLDEASLPDEQKMVLKVLHPYLDECKVAFVAIANKSFDAANANRMICIYRSLPSKDDQTILAYGCLGLQVKRDQQVADERLQQIISGLCQGYRRILDEPTIPRIYHDRDFIYMLRELRFELTTTTTDDQETRITGITPVSLLRAIEDNFNGVKRDEFEKLVNIFFQAVKEQCPDFSLPTNRRNVPTILRESMKLDSVRRRLYGRYKLIIDESEDESAVRLLSQNGIIDTDPNRTTVFRMSDFTDDINNELRNVEILSTIKLCMETGKTILMVNTGRIHGSLYDVFNQNFSIMATGDMRKIFSKVAIGPKTIDVVVHEDFQCIVHVKRSEFVDIPPPFLSRFQKYLLSVNDFYRIQFEQLTKEEQNIMKNVEDKLHSFIQHFGSQYFYGLNDNTLYSCLLSLIKRNENEGNYYLNVHQNYTQFSIKSKSFIEQNPTDIQLCVLRHVISKLIQLASPESIILKLPTFEDQFARRLCNNYFHKQEHFNIENFIQNMISNPSIDLDDFNLLTAMDENVQKSNDISIVRKIMIFTRTSSYIIGLNEQSKNELFGGLNDNEYNGNSHNIEILNLAVIENSVELEERFHSFEKHETNQVLIIIINARIIQQRLHIPYVRQLIDKIEYSCNVVNRTKDKFFLMLIHSPAQEQYHQSSFPSIFLHNWDIHFFDCCVPGSAFHLQKMLQILSSSFDQQQQQQEKESLDNSLCDLNILFDDCLWDFCSRIQIALQDLPSDMFKNKFAYEFYQRQTSTSRRVHCLKQILQEAKQLQNRIVTIYHDHLSTKKESSRKIYTTIYQISKDIICGKRFDGLVESIQSQTRVSFTNFVSNVFKFIVNDYGLETLLTFSNTRNGFDSMLELIDYSSFSNDNEDKDTMSQLNQRIFQLVSHHSCIPQTPLYYLFHQRIKSYAEDIKLRRILKQTEHRENDDALRQDYYSVPSMIATNDDESESNEYTFEQFRYELMKLILNDKVLVDIINGNILNSYSNDLVRTFCTIVEKNFDNNTVQYQKTIDFVARWLLLIDENDREALSKTENRHIWLVAHIHTSFAYDQNDLFSFYSACRILDQLDETQSCYDELLLDDRATRSEIREKLFRLMFNYLWRNLCQLCSNHYSSESWTYIYTFVSKYYPSDIVLRRVQLIEIKEQIEFMNLAYLILLNDTTPHPEDLLAHLLNDIHNVHINKDVFHINQEKSIYLKLLPKLIDSIQSYLENNNVHNSTLMIDLQQWIVSMLKSSKESCEEEIENLFRGLSQSHYRLPLPMKQLLFDKLADLYCEFKRSTNKKPMDFWTRLLTLLPFIVDCVADENNLRVYELPYHPSIITNHNQQEPLIDFYFFYVQRYFNDETINFNLLNKVTQANASQIRGRNTALVKEMFQKLKTNFHLRLTAVLLCQIDTSVDEKQKIDRIASLIITSYLSIDQTVTQLNSHLHIFLSTIIAKRSWHYLINLLKSDRIKNVNHQWANSLCGLLEINQNAPSNKYLQLCHQIQFASSLNNTSSIFPDLHQSYEQCKTILTDCIKENIVEQRWKKLLDWVELQRNVNPPVLGLKEIKVILLLNIYYDYYCTKKLDSLNTLIVFIENTLEPLPEELRVFRAILQPEQFMIGYVNRNDNAESNFLNKLFRPDCQDEDELCIRHSLVNLIAMILMGGKQSFLWTFTFEPLKLSNTFGFGSTAHTVIQSNGVHYDCGCIITQNGDLMQFEAAHTSALNVPAIYVAYFSTFGAMAWHLLLFNESVQNLHGPILAKHAIADNTAECRIAGNDDRTKVCHFVRARLLSTFNFLSLRSNPDDACIVLNRCFEQMALLTINHQQAENAWIKPVFTTLNDELTAEKKYQEHVFYFVHGKLAEYKTYINHLNLQSQIQTKLQDFVTKMPLAIHFSHFKTELHNPIHSDLPLKILRQVLDSTDFLKITQLIYDLSQFYLLLHQTYTQLIEQNEFHTINLEELYLRAEKHFHERHDFQCGNQNNNYSKIIDNGIKAVNDYHEFTDGLIRLGACDRTQRFTKISRETPIHYLVTTTNSDEGDIIMRILSVLIDYHNNLLKLLETEMNKDDNSMHKRLKTLVNKFTSKEISILQIVQDNTGVITLNDNDWSWIEQLSCASLINDNNEYFQLANTQINFNFIYLQSYIIRAYLLFCRINYTHIIQKYQCHVKRIQFTTDGETLDLDEKYTQQLNRQQLEADWNHLKEMYLDKLYHGHNLLRQISLILKNNQDDLSQLNLYEFINSLGDDNSISKQIQQYEIKDFQLCYIDHIRQLYANSTSGFQHLFTNVSQLLRVPIDSELDKEINQIISGMILSFDQDSTIENIKSTIQTITDLLNDLTSNENYLSIRSAYSIEETFTLLDIENSILNALPNEIKCENYVAISIHLIRMRTILQEKVVNIEEKQDKQWNEIFYNRSAEQHSNKPNLFHDLLHEQDITNKPKGDNSDDDDLWLVLPESENSNLTETYSSQHQNSTSNGNIIEEYSSLFELHVKFVPLISSILFEEIHRQYEQAPIQAAPLNKAQKFIITYSDGKPHPFLWKSEILFEKLRNLFDKEKIDLDKFVLIDKNEIFVDFTNNNARLPKQILLEYQIIEKASLYSIQFIYQNNTCEYFATSKSKISTLIDRFINDNEIKLSSNNNYLCFFDFCGKTIEDGTVAGLIKQFESLDNKAIKITVSEEDHQTNMLCQVTLRTKQDNEHTSLFHRTAQWQQIDTWLTCFNFNQLIDATVQNYAYIDKESKTILDKTQSIYVTIDEPTKSVVIDGIDRNLTTKVIFSYENHSESLNVLKSMRISHILNNERLLRDLHLIDISPNDCVLVVGESNEQILSQNDIRQSLSSYLQDNDQSIHFRISITIQVFKYDDKEPIEVLLSNRNVTMEHVFQLTKASIDIYKYLASNYTKKIIDFSEKLSNLNDTKFILVKEHETCLVKIDGTKNSQLIEIDDANNDAYQRFTLTATIADIYRENQIEKDHQNLLYSQDFVPSIETKLISFASTTPIQFTLIDGNLPVRVTILNDENQQSIKFYCKLTMTVKRLSTIACQLFGVNNNYYRLMLDECLLDDDDVSLEDIDQSMTYTEFKLISTASTNSSIKYANQTIIVPCSNDTKVATIIDETLQKLHLPVDDRDMYELVALDDDETPIESDMTIDDVYALFPSHPTNLPFKLLKKND